MTGDVRTNDTLGDTPTTVTAATDDDGDVITLGAAFPTDAGGSRTLNADGSYSYTPPAGLTEVFNYTITEADGDISSSTLTITVSEPP